MEFIAQQLSEEGKTILRNAMCYLFAVGGPFNMDKADGDAHQIMFDIYTEKYSRLRRAISSI